MNTSNVDLEALRHSAPTDGYVRPSKDPENLQVLYHDLGWSQSDIAEFYDCDQSAISRAMNDAGIETRPPMHLRDRSISRSVREDGRVQYQVPDGEGGRERFYRYQLVALLEFDAGDVFADNTHIHHKMGSPVAVDVPANLDVLEDREHVRLHTGDDYDQDEAVAETLAEIFVEDDVTVPSITPPSTETTGTTTDETA